MQTLRQLVPRGKKQLLANLLAYSGMNHLLGQLPSWSGLLVLNYHRIGQPASTPFDRNLFSATAEQLERQIVSFQSQADIIGLDDLPEVLQSRRGKYILLTFDDGYRDNYELAFPVLRDCRAQATFFIATDFIDRPQVAWWDEIAWMLQQTPLTSLPAGQWFSAPVPIEPGYPAAAIATAVRTYWSLPNEKATEYLQALAEITQVGRAPQELSQSLWMTWDMIRELAAAGQDIGGHTLSHPVLAQCSVEQQRDEIFGSRDRLQTQLGTAPLAFSYPVGQSHMFTAATQDLVSAAGYRWAFSFYGNYCGSRPANAFDLPRCAVDFQQSTSLFQARLILPQLFARK